MNTCAWIPEVERFFDGMAADETKVRAHLAECPHCASHLRRLETMRAGIQAVKPDAHIADSQFPAFLEGVRQRINKPRRRHSGLWALASLAAAALIVSISATLIFAPKMEKAAATVVESCSTELEGATAVSYESEDGEATVWVTTSREDLW